MAEIKEFKPVKEFGALSTGEESEMKFYADEYRGYSYGSIRTFLKRAGYAGPTKAGVTMNSALLEKVLAALAALPDGLGTAEDRELARFPKKAGVEFVVRWTVYKGAAGIDLREWVQEENYTGWSKRGARIPHAALPQALTYLRQMLDFLKTAKGPS